MTKMRVIKTGKSIPTRKKKVAGYARVSRDSVRLMHSVSAQISYYSNLIQNNPEWEYVGVYADEGITGTLIERREEFQRMLEDCAAGKIDIILTKSVSRFARNTVDLLNTVRYLRNMDIEVRFEEQNINTLSGEGELMLTILASFAQEESVSMSQNIKWAKRKQAEKGEMTNAVVPFGYRFENGMPLIVPEQAEVVREMYAWFVDEGLSDYEIRNRLTDLGIKTPRGGKWTATTVRRILMNVTYTGNMLLGKYYSPDPLKHKHAPNRGEAPQYFVEGSHEPIISQALYDAAQIKREQRRDLPRGYHRKGTFNHFSGKIICCGCDLPFGRYTNRMRGGNKVPAWSCKKTGGKCMTTVLLESELEKISAEMMGLEIFDPGLFKERIDHIEVDLDDTIYFFFRNGTVNAHRFTRRKRSPLKERRTE